MTEDSKQPMQAIPDRSTAGATGDVETGRDGGGESGGGAYKDKDQVKGDPDNGGIMKHGGQSHIDYSGPVVDDGKPANPNATAGS